jgi:hypothetical protein
MENNVVVRQITAESKKLEQIRNETEHLAAAYAHTALIAHVLFGRDESLVDRDVYKNDELDVSEPEKDHWSICKPRHDYRKPLSFVAYGKSSTRTIGIT